VRADGLLWIAIPCIAVGLWLAHDGFQSPAVVASARQPSQLLLRLQDYLVQADLERWTPWRVLLLCIVSASFGGVLVGWAGWGLATIVAVLAGLVAPLLWIQARHGAVYAQTRQGLATALAQLAESLVAGHTIERGAQGLAEDGPPRLRPYFAQFCHDVDELDLQRAALRLREGLADPVSDLFVAGLLLHVQLGGDDFRPMLGELEKMTRDQQSIRDRLAGLRTRLKFSAYILLAAPVFILVTLRSWSPVVSAFFDSPDGVVVLVVSALVMIAGYLLTLYLGRLPGDERVLVR